MCDISTYTIPVEARNQYPMPFSITSYCAIFSRWNLSEQGPIGSARQAAQPTFRICCSIPTSVLRLEKSSAKTAFVWTQNSNTDPKKLMNFTPLSHLSVPLFIPYYQCSVSKNIPNLSY